LKPVENTKTEVDFQINSKDDTLTEKEIAVRTEELVEKISV
jgi:hypothetical protein